MYKKYKNKLLATAMSVPICLLSVALQTNRVKADETIPETQNTLSRNEQNSQTASNVNAASINQDDRKGTESQTNKLVRTNSNSAAQDEDQLNSDLSYVKVSVESSPTSSETSPLSWANIGYVLSFKVENTSNVSKTIPKGTKIRISFNLDSRVSLKRFLAFNTINQNENNFSVVNNNDKGFDIIANKDLMPGIYNFKVNFQTQNPGYDWNKPTGTNSTDPDVCPGDVLVHFAHNGKDNQIFENTVFIKPAGYYNGGGGGSIPGFAVAGINGDAAFKNVDPAYPNESDQFLMTDGISLMSPNDLNSSGSKFFSYLVNYTPSIGTQYYAKIGIHSDDKIDLAHVHVLADPREFGLDKVIDITNDPLVHWNKLTDNDIEIDASPYLLQNNVYYRIYLKVYVPEESIKAINHTSFLVSWYDKFKNTSMFQDVQTDSSNPSFRGNDATIYNTSTYNAKEDVYALEGTNSVTDKIIVTNYDGYPQDGKNPKVGTYTITYSVTGSDPNTQVTFSRKITVKENKATINAKDSTIAIGEKTSWDPKDNFVSATDEDGNSIDVDRLNVTGTVNLQKVGDYKVTYSYSYKDDSNKKQLISARVDKTVTIHVVQSKASIKAHDTTIYQGDSWNPQDNFDEATDAIGNALNLDQVSVTGTVDTQKLGTYPVKYSYTDSTGNTVEADANVTVKQRVEKLPVKAGNVTVHFVDASGNKIAPDQILSGNVGDGYISSPLDIDDYVYDSVNGNRIGYFTNLPQTVTYIYHKKASTTKPEQSTDNNSTNKPLPNDKAKKPDNNKKSKQTNDAQTSGKNKSALTQEDKNKAQTASNKASQQKTEADKAKLPQTGTEKKSQLALLISGIIALFGSLLGALDFRKKKGE